MLFAEWVFGPGRLPALQVLAFGDFSYGDRYRGQQFLIRRAYPIQDSNGKGLAGLKCDDTTRLPFRPVDMADPSIQDGVSVDGARFLSVCPGGGLMESPYELQACLSVLGSFHCSSRQTASRRKYFKYRTWVNSSAKYHYYLLLALISRIHIFEVGP